MSKFLQSSTGHCHLWLLWLCYCRLVIACLGQTISAETLNLKERSVCLWTRINNIIATYFGIMYVKSQLSNYM